MSNQASRSAVLVGRLVPIVVGAAVLAVPALAGAEVFEVKIEQVSTNCDHPVNYPQRGAVKIEIKGADLQVDIDRTPLMVGKPSKAGRVNARSPKPGHTPIEGMDGVFSVAGRVTGEGMLSLVMVGEFQTGGKPLCTQSWKVEGLKRK